MMSSPLGNYELLAKHFGGSQPNSGDIANFILLNSPVGSGKIGSKKEGNDPSLMGRIFDILSRGNYASANLAKAGMEHTNPLSAIWRGITGEEKTTYADILDKSGMRRGAERSLLSFALDVGLDPTTYIPVAGIASKLKSATKAGKASAESARVLADVPTAQRVIRQGDIPVNPENYGLPSGPAVPSALRGSGIPSQDSVLQSKNAILPVSDTRPATDAPIRISDTAWPGSNPSAPTLPGMDRMVPSLSKIKAPVDDAVESAAKEVPGQQALRFPDFNVTKIRKANTAVTAPAVDVASESAEATVKAVSEGSVEAAAKTVAKPAVIVDARSQRHADDILAKWTDSSTAELNKKYPDTINAKQQVKLYFRALDAAKSMFKNPNSPANVAKVRSNALKIYTAIENTLEARGKSLRIDSGETVKLSQVIEKVKDLLSPADLKRSVLASEQASSVASEFVNPVKGSFVWKAIEDLRAGSAIKDTPTVKEIISKIADSKSQMTASNKLSDAQTKDFDKFLKEFGKATAKAEGVSPAAAKATENLITANITSYKSIAQVAVEQNSRMLDDVIATGKQNTQTNKVLTRALEKDLGKLPSWSTGDNKAVESVMGRVATWWGQKDLRSYSLNAIGAAKATATVREHVLSDLFKPFNLAQRHEALKLAQGIGVPSSAETAELAVEIQKMVDNLVGRAAGQSVLFRSAVDFKLLNKWMNRYVVGFQFSKGKAKNLLGQEVDYSKGTDWVNSWKTADIKQDPHLFLFNFQQAMEQATREKAMFVDLAERFGSVVPGKGYRVKIQGHPYLEGYHFTEDIAKQIPRVIKDWSMDAWHPKSPAVGLYDRVMSMWKSGVTIYRPGHHVRNIIGDVYLGWMDGVNSVRPYVLAAKVQKSMHGAYTTMMDVEKLVDAGVLSKNFKTPAPNQILFRNKSGVPFTAEQIAAVAHNKGLLEHTSTLEDIIDMGVTGKNKILDAKPFGGKVQGVARGASELQSHNARLAHFIDKVSKSHGSNLDDIFEQASRRARKWHPTGLDLTDFEKKYMRRIMPFYSWMRKSLPLLAEGLLMNPGKAVSASKASEAIQDYQGIVTPGRDDPFPVDQMFPEWMRTEGLGPIGLPDGLLGSVSNQSPPGYVMAGMGVNPLTSMIGQLEDPGKMALTGLTPAIQVPVELMSGTKLSTGQPIRGLDAPEGAMGQYVGEQLPIWSALQGILGVTPTGGATSAANKSSTAQRQALTNFLTGLGVQGSGPYVKQGRFEKQAPIDAKRKAGKEQLLKMLRERTGN